MGPDKHRAQGSSPWSSTNFGRQTDEASDSLRKRWEPRKGFGDQDLCLPPTLTVMPMRIPLGVNLHGLKRSLARL